MILKEVYEEDASTFGGKFRSKLQTKLFSIAVAHGDSQTVISNLLKDAVVCIGCAKYGLDLLIAPAGQWITSLDSLWNVTIKPHLSCMTLCAEEEMHNQVGQMPYRGGQDVPIIYQMSDTDINLSIGPQWQSAEQEGSNDADSHYMQRGPAT
jgi:hypothetical protein